ncbi:MAG: chromosome partitioning protein ParB [Gammaproteobacteria bacterium]|nr:chromosome partitioning protein ParB [Gammaproteobacteria bacterium]
MTAPDESAQVHGISRVDVTHIHHYARNPRRQPHPEYHRIKASIQAEGLDQPLVITREPGADDYVLHTGGNTRLRILKELYEETAEERYRKVDCVIRPWSQESTVLFAHLRENELRSGLPFIDKALAVFDAKALLEKELLVETLSQRQLEELFRERGFSLSHSMISKMGYAVDVLWPVMPKALAAGLGRPQVEKIRALARAARELWCHLGLGDENLFDEVFGELCRRYDCAEWDNQLLRTALENELAVESEHNQQVIYLALEARLVGKPFDHLFDREMAESRENKNASTVEGTFEVDEEKEADDKLWERAESDKSLMGAGETTPVYNDIEEIKTVAEPSPAETPGDEPDLQSLRHQLWESADKLAERHGLSDRVIALPGRGLGFLVCDVPPQELSDALDPDTLGLVSTLWWHLAACSEITVAPVDRLLRFLDEDTTLHRALASQDAGLLFNSVWTRDPGHLGSQLWQQLNPPDWQLLLQMIETYRTMKRYAHDTGLELWLPQGEVADVFE